MCPINRKQRICKFCIFTHFSTTFNILFYPFLHYIQYFILPIPPLLSVFYFTHFSTTFNILFYPFLHCSQYFILPISPLFSIFYFTHSSTVLNILFLKLTTGQQFVQQHFGIVCAQSHSQLNVYRYFV